MALEQIAIALSGAIGVWLTQDTRESWRRWACIFGMVGQPFWFYATWKAEQWGIFALCTLYTYGWARGVWTHWLSRYFQPARCEIDPSRIGDWLKRKRGRTRLGHCTSRPSCWQTNHAVAHGPHRLSQTRGFRRRPDIALVAGPAPSAAHAVDVSRPLAPGDQARFDWHTTSRS
jgi:hypothetical protein